MRYDIPGELIAVDSVDDLLLTRLVQRIHDNEGTDKRLATWAIVAWATVLDKTLPTSPVAQEYLLPLGNAVEYFNRGVDWDNKGDYDMAIADYTKAIEIDPRFAEAYYHRGLAWRKRKDHEKAIADFTRVIEINPQHADAYYYRGYTYYYESVGSGYSVASRYIDKGIADYTRSAQLGDKRAQDFLRSKNIKWEEKQ
ncbi:MAG: tetratricopeptide repeat protein [Nitrospirae bacterium]|nr:tetratricopeptide repeat protein [Nitrospirota bacterium]